LETESIVIWQTTQYQLYLELVEGSSWTRGLDKNLVKSRKEGLHNNHQRIETTKRYLQVSTKYRFIRTNN